MLANNKINVTDGSVLLVNKPLHWTSFDVVNKLRYVLKKNLHHYIQIDPKQKRNIKVGHAGTLDPLASGLLIVCVGKQTKNIDQYMATEKEYTGTITLGATTPSFDLETQPDKQFATEHLTDELIISTAQQFIGNIQQMPPVFSAIKKDGKRLYEHARAGNEIELTPRAININTFEITHINIPEITFRVVCSKGTYIRSLANDFGKALDSGGYLSSLCRTRSGQFKLADALSVDQWIEVIEQH